MSQILADSTLELVEKATHGSYETLVIRLEARDGMASLTAEKDGVVTSVEVSSDAVMTLWKAAMASGLETLETQRGVAEVAPDQSHFTVRFHVGRTSREFTVTAVDTSEDKRYRTIIREILHFADAHAYGKTWQK